MQEIAERLYVRTIIGNRTRWTVMQLVKTACYIQWYVMRRLLRNGNKKQVVRV